ncbi:MAG: dTDP-4-dehydrorhamnose reductase [Casimicrobiaceae bacterium]
MSAALPRILITGAEGQLGFELVRELAPLATVVATGRTELDLADKDAIVAAMRTHAPDLVINAAAYTGVDQAEREPAKAQAINAIAPGILAEEAKRSGALLIHYSTDYVFDGLQQAAYTEDALTRPCNVYGHSKLDGERAIDASGACALVLRTSWVYGRRGRNFLLTMKRLARERDELRVVADQHGTPNWSRTLARATAGVIAEGVAGLRDRAGLYHLSCTGTTTWFGFATRIVSEAQRELAHEGNKLPRVVPITTAEYPTPAHRPTNSALDAGKFMQTFGCVLPPWEQALAECLSGSNDSRE